MSERPFALVGWGGLLLAVLLTLAFACSGARTQQSPPRPPALAPSTLELWVDAQAEEGGDASRARPLRHLAPALAMRAPQRLVHLAPGLYAGPFVALDGTELVGGSAAVLTAPVGGPVLEAHGAVRLTRLLVQGGTVGLLATGALQLEGVRFSGQREVGLHLEKGGSLAAAGSLFEASVSGGVGLLLETGAEAQLHGCTFEGPWQRAIEARAPGNLHLANSSFRGAVTALQLVGGRADVADVTISEGRGPALFVSGGALSLHRVEVRGHEYALLTGSGAAVEAEDLSSTGADRAGVGVVQAKAHFVRLSIASAGTLGGLQCVSSEVRVEGLRVTEVRGSGVSTRGGSLRLDDAVVRRTREPDGSGGDGVQLRGGRTTLANLTVQDASGACLLAAEGADVQLSHASFERCHTAGLAVETGARLWTSAVTVQSSQGPGAVATSDGELVLRSFRALATDGVVWAECSNGAQVRTLDVAGVLPTLPCVLPLSAAEAP
jgi:hypothetical protein